MIIVIIKPQKNVAMNDFIVSCESISYSVVVYQEYE